MEFRQNSSVDEDVSPRLLDSAAELSYDPSDEVDWDAPVPEDKFGINPEWSTLYGTPLWDEMTFAQQITLTKHEVCSIMCTGIWFEMILQQMLIRDHYVKDPVSARFQFALTEVADECRHSIMFARVCEKLGVRAYFPTRFSVELGRAFKALAFSEVAYGGILVAEEILDVMQRDWMRGENVQPMVRTTSKIHVVEESRHMKFARQEIVGRMNGVGAVRRGISSLVVAIAAYVIVKNMVNKGVYAAAGLDTGRALGEVRHNAHHRAMMRLSCVHLMDFLSEVGLLTRPAMVVYQRVHML